jgi:hypothetical protein
MAKKAAAKKSAAKKSAAKRTGARTRARMIAGKKGVDFKSMHDAMDAALAELQRHKKSAKRDGLIKQLKTVRSLEFCPKHAMFAELE